MAKPQTPTTTETAPAEGPVHGHEALAQAVAALLRGARREIRLFSPHLDPVVFNAVADALASFAVRHPRNRARLLIEDTAHLQRDHGLLLDIVRRLADRVELRAVEDNDRGARDLYLIADRSACLRQEDIGRNDAVATRSPYEAAQLIDRFDAGWDRATPVALHTLGL